MPEEALKSFIVSDAYRYYPGKALLLLRSENMSRHA